MSNVNNGKRLAVKLVDFDGEAGFVDRNDGTAQLSYQPNGKGTVGVSSIVTADSRRWRVVRAGRSDYASHLQVLELVAVA